MSGRLPTHFDPRTPDILGPPVPPKPLQLTSEWPGLDGTNADVYMDHTRVRQILNNLRTALSTLEQHPPVPMFNPATIGSVRERTNVGPPETGQWVIGHAFGENVSNASEVLSRRYIELHNQIQAMISAIERSVVNYEKWHADSSL